MLSQGKSQGVGMTQVCIYASNVKVEASRIEKATGIKPMAPQAHRKTGATITAFQYPDGIIVCVPYQVPCRPRCFREMHEVVDEGQDPEHVH